MKLFSAVLAIALLAAASGLAAPAGHTARMHGLSFTTSLEFSLAAEAGLDALRIVSPKNAKPGTEKMSVTMVRFPAEAVGAGGMSDAELLDYVKSAFLAAGSAGRPVEREFLGRKARGEAFAKSIPAPASAEVYVVALASGAKIVLGFAFDPGFAAAAGEAIAETAATLSE